MNTFGMDTQLLNLKEALELVVSRYRDEGVRYADIIFELDEMAERLHPLAEHELIMAAINAETQP